LTYRKIIVVFAFFSTGGLILNEDKARPETATPRTTEILTPTIPPISITTTTDILENIDTEILEIELATTETEALKSDRPKKIEGTIINDNGSGVFEVPFFSQFTDISAANWKKVGCGIASLAMLIEFHEPDSVTVDGLLAEGIAADAYLSDAGWTHSGLIKLSKKYGLTGSSHDMSGSSMEAAFNQLEEVLETGPVMVSVHYTFDPQNPIPHLVVVNGVQNGQVYYNDPAEKAGEGSIPISKFQSAWKKRYIEIHTT
jgi:predicted double-glycine peptidase